jgi:ribosome-associated protein
MIENVKQEMLAAIEAAESKKAENVVILEMDKTAGAFTDHFIICTGSSSRQIQSISDEIELQVKRQTGTYAHQVEGYREAEWVLVDYMDFIVHVFNEERRAFYGLERLWKSARTMSVAEFKAAPVGPEEESEAVAEVALVGKKAAKKARPAKALSTKAAKTGTGTGTGTGTKKAAKSTKKKAVKR